MGKGFYNNKNNRVKVILATLLSVMLLVASNSSASYKEFELFEQGYEYYLSYQPEKAAETFKTFLKEFTDSSAKDAAMFWLGKSLIHLKSFEEAKKVLSEIKQQFPDSPFIPYVSRELEMISRAEPGANKTEAGFNVALKEKNTLELKLAEAEKKAELKEKDLARIAEERDKLRAQLEEEKKKAEEMRARITKLEGKGDVLKILQAKFEEPQRDWKKYDEYLEQLKNEREKLDFQIQKLKKEKALIENERAELEDKVKRYESIALRIKDKQYTTPQIFEFMINSSAVINKLEIKEVLWRTGNFCEDFVNEQILYDEAKRLNITADMKKYKEQVERYNLKKEDADYLFRYLTIGDLIDRKVKDMPGEKVVESLLIVYTKSDEFEKAILATELQKDAKSGRSFEDIYKSYPDVVRLRLIRFQELQGWIKDRIQLLQDGEISDVVWTEDGYMILRPVLKRLSYRPFEDVRPEMRDKMRLFIKGWIDELRKEAKGNRD